VLRFIVSPCLRATDYHLVALDRPRVAAAPAAEACTATSKPWAMARTIERGVSTRRGWPGIGIGRA
jgi:hypothetical protein